MRGNGKIKGDEKMKEWKLTDKRMSQIQKKDDLFENRIYGYFYKEIHVREFIRRLNEEFIDVGRYGMANKFIDKISGEKLTR